jgi:hypothetical protein
VLNLDADAPSEDDEMMPDEPSEEASMVSEDGL